MKTPKEIRGKISNSKQSKNFSKQRGKLSKFNTSRKKIFSSKLEQRSCKEVLWGHWKIFLNFFTHNCVLNLSGTFCYEKKGHFKTPKKTRGKMSTPKWTKKRSKKVPDRFRTQLCIKKFKKFFQCPLRTSLELLCFNFCKKQKLFTKSYFEVTSVNFPFRI